MVAASAGRSGEQEVLNGAVSVPQGDRFWRWMSPVAAQRVRVLGGTGPHA